MTERDAADKTQDTPFADWGKAMTDFWGPFMNQWSGMFKASGSQESAKLRGRIGESIETTTKMWQAMLAAVSEPSALEHFQRATQMTPDIALGFAQTCLRSFTGLQAQVGEWIQQRGASLSTADMQELDKELIRKWAEAYENEFSQYLKLPQIGLGRFTRSVPCRQWTK